MITEHTGADAWRNNLITTAGGSPKPLLANAITAFRDCASWNAVVSYDVFALRTLLDGAPPWSMELTWTPRPWSPQDDLLAADWLQRHDIPVNVATTAQAIEAVARDRSFHPVIDHLDSLEHDGTARLDNWLTEYLGVEPSAYAKHVGRAMMIAAIARIRQPGCKVDTVPILEGRQGARKSTAIKVLFEPWFTDELADLGSKDAAMQTQGIWCAEIAELDAMSRSEVSKIKAFISRTTDRFRPPYGSRIIESDRACVFWGSTNAEGYLKDETGGRRFWPIKVGKIDIDRLTADRDQLWAEAQILYHANVPWWLTKADVQDQAESQQADRYVGDPWDRYVADYADSITSKSGYVETTINDVLIRALNMQIGACGQLEQTRVARILRSLGFVRRQRGSGASKRWTYSRVVPGAAQVVPVGEQDNNVTSLRVVPATVAPLGTTHSSDQETLSQQA
ncbi:putative P-loop ATPase [Bradyrhizobium sp. USDA 4524]|uniref:virulence-associated E family protein n=1 Tax=unclassified Bradyrhizobium TaxID=2631580 RepID=UPI00209DCBE4|nr:MULTISPECIES: virulence-associated E family protein [unclassified Bradyrhizobium]MCP1844408.1 putative P-loop ATPase [Bradyrhizobium sp. USDA 4538]MCP1904974.1 putative P-loop ATPase [Bradyrhizobium sp. USDA 4537]MCP1989370.1 putative P-loop ATPase [Bradyrhizobium sp. USDA 4539]